MLPLAIILVVLLIAIWFVALFAEWKSERQQVTPIELEPFQEVRDRLMRLTRRGYYSATLYGKQGMLWGTKKATTIFVKVVPGAASAFAEKDALSGLSHGPSSYFLQSISESKPKKAAKHLFHRKKML